MFYKPNYCCNCGEKVERIEWHLWTNRRFCEICETDHQLDDWIKRTFSTIFVLFGLFGVGIYFQGNKKNVDVSKSEMKSGSQKIQQLRTIKPKALKKSRADTVQSIEQKDKKAYGTQTGTLQSSAPLEENIQLDNKRKEV